ncbi:Glycine oxidase [Symmachiella dynata]|uniref:Glycine oxidase n=1 Tax=Symmachiella dynata TaxID=2527995 RepID=A0A517ZNP1_9PLAN|nr:FAD-binding oxidoreductase [Symmachiella dynata]QDU44099.1 Glycine oxidase [Symmachiella dynata]
MSQDSIWFATLNDTERAELRAYAGREVLTTPDVLIVGGGIVGAATAYSLSQQGVQVQVVEAGTLGGLASGANAGGIWPDQQGIEYPEAFRNLARRSRDLWGKLPARDGFDFDWRVNGFVTVDPMHWETSPEDLAMHLLSEGLSAHAIDGEQVKLLEPHLRSDITGGVHYPSEAHVHPVKAVLSFARASTAQFSSETRAISMDVKNGRVQSVQTTAGTIQPGHVIAATGWMADWFAAQTPTPPPLTPISGQMIATAPQPPLLKNTVLGKAIVFQLLTGEVVTGGSMVEGDATTPDAQVTADFAKMAGDLLPALKDVPFPHAWTGARPTTPDRLPILDRLPGVDNFLVAAGHFKNGLLLAPITGELMTEWTVAGKPSLDLTSFRWDRF